MSSERKGRYRLATSARLRTILPESQRPQPTSPEPASDSIEAFTQRLTDFVRRDDRYRQLPAPLRQTAISVAAEMLAIPDDSIFQQSLRVEKIPQGDPLAPLLSDTILAQSRFSLYIDAVDAMIRTGSSKNVAQHDGLTLLRASLAARQMRERVHSLQPTPRPLGKNQQRAVALVAEAVIHIANADRENQEGN